MIRKSLEINENVNLVCIQSPNVFLKEGYEFDLFALIKNGNDINCVRPTKLNEDQIKMSVDEYISSGRCEFFKNVRPNHIFKLMGMFK